ncbi:hypothetical protein GCM10010168_87550 [Actinoplanes ianthinogenes]|nr:hypothetical protein GCM10010168_87550 [Actinoplanes ianthinogenes]
MALSANEYGASFCGAAISSSRISGRGESARNPATAWVNGSGTAEGDAMGEAYADLRPGSRRRAAGRLHSRGTMTR